MTNGIIVTKDFLEDVSIHDIIQYFVENFKEFKFNNDDFEKIIELKNDEDIIAYYNEVKNILYGDFFENKQVLLSELVNIIISRFYEE